MILPDAPILPAATFDEQQAATARWLGCSVDEMNRDHDPTHVQLCNAFGFASLSLAPDRSPDEDRLALLEETAVMHVQRWLVAMRRRGR
jgi:hypothetical protein